MPHSNATEKKQVLMADFLSRESGWVQVMSAEVKDMGYASSLFVSRQDEIDRNGLRDGL